MKKVLIPLALFLGLVVFLAIGLQRDPREIPSPLLNKPAPQFRLQTLGNASFGPEDLKGQVWLLNVWATWCTACREEHPLLVAMSQKLQMPLVGLNYKEVQFDENPELRNADTARKLDLARSRSEKWLRTHGNPYSITAFDLDGRVGIDYGVYGVPETYVIDKAGVIRYKRVGAITPEVLEQNILPLIRQLKDS
jgi:cytochrome c biogenesis protein CcmG, thiol:disulfide interchange protein DsbE